MTAGLAGIIVVAIAGLAALQVLAPTDRQVVGHAWPVPSLIASLSPEPLPSVQAKQVEVVENGEIYTSNKARVQLPSKGGPDSVTSAYRARAGYLVVQANPAGGKQLLLFDEQHQQKVLIDGAASIAISANGERVAWSKSDTMSVADRDAKKPQLGAPITVAAPTLAAPVAFVGGDVILGREEDAGFDLWQPGQGSYEEKWDLSVLRVFGAHRDHKSFYAQVRDDTGQQMCLALLGPGRPFTLIGKKICGLPVPTKQGGISPDGRWLAYPVVGKKQIAVLDLEKVFTAGYEARTWDNLTVTGRTVWLNSTTFVVDNGTDFVGLNPNSLKTDVEPVEGRSANKVLVEPLAP